MNIINKMAAGSTGLTCTVQEVSSRMLWSSALVLCTVILISLLQVLNCALPSWYDQFKGHTVKTYVCTDTLHDMCCLVNALCTCTYIRHMSVTCCSSFVALSSDFISYLKEDRVFLPKE